MNLKTISGMGLSDAEGLLRSLRLDESYARRLLYWVYRKGIRSLEEINDIPVRVLQVLSGHVVPGLVSPIASEASSDGSVKYLFPNEAGLAHETVWLPDGKRSTVCVSVQAGCRMGCRFCATGRNGWGGNLSAGEIVNQVISIPDQVTHIVLMGMGEPGDNIDAVIRACGIFTAEWGLAAGRSKVTVSTVGVTPSVKRLLEETDCNITLSLHSPFPEERREVIPAEGRWPFRETLSIMKEYDNRNKRRFTVAYVMIKGKNDTDRHLSELKRLLSGTEIRVNLLPYHPSDLNDDRSSGSDTMMRFKHELVTSGIGASVRKSRGTDIAAACGMLVAKRDKIQEELQKKQWKMDEKAEINDRRPGAESWEKLLRETLGKTRRVPFKGGLKVDNQVLELFDHSNQCFFIGDYSSLRMIFVSPNIVNVLGYTPEEFDFRKLFGIIHPDDGKAVFEIGKMVLSRELNYIAGGSSRHIALFMAYRVAKSNGKFTRISLTVSRHTDPVGGIYDMAEIRDISHVRCGTEVSFALLGGKPLKDLAQEPRKGLSISRREQEIIYYISQGYTSRKIAYELNLSEYTVNTHRKNIMRKTGTSNMVDMLLFAANNGII